MTPRLAAELGHIDAIIDPAETRKGRHQVARRTPVADPAPSSFTHVHHLGGGFVALINTSGDAESGAKSLSPRERIELLVDPASVLEIAAKQEVSNLRLPE